MYPSRCPLVDMPALSLCRVRETPGRVTPPARLHLSRSCVFVGHERVSKPREEQALAPAHMSCPVTLYRVPGSTPGRGEMRMYTQDALLRVFFMRMNKV